MKKVLISFGSAGYERGLDGLRHSAKNYFDKITLYSPSDIDKEFVESNKHIWECSRGFGYWIWKPYIILKTMENLNDGDFCFYSDSLINFVNNPYALFNICKLNDGFMLFNQHASGWTNNIWTKGDCFYLMDALDDAYVFGDHLNAAFQLYQKNEKTMLFVKQFLNYCLDFRVISDSENIFQNNFEGFRAHRHDQSIFSILAIKHKIKTFRDISQYGNDDKDSGCSYPQIINHHRSK